VPAGEIYVPIPVNFADEPAIAALRRYGRDARSLRDLYVQMHCYCKRTLSDGFVPAEQIGLLVYPDPPKTAARDVKRLMDAGVVELAVGGYFVPAYLERNPTRAKVEKTSADKAKGVQAGNHQRWHVDRGESDPRCELCQDAIRIASNGHCVSQSSDDRTDDRMTDALLNASVPSDSTRQDKTRQDKETNPPAASRSTRGDPNPDDDLDFTAFWAVYPRKRDKKPAFKAWGLAIKRKAEPKEIIAGAEIYRDECASASRLPKHIKLPGTWLNGDCWTNEDESENEAEAAKAQAAGRFNYPNSPWEN
jgi:hypothetical protein